MDTSILRRQKFTNVQTVQAGVAKLFEEAKKTGSFYQVLRNGDEPLGILMPQQVWEDWLEDQDAQNSESYKKRIAKARKEKGGISLEKIEQQIGL